MKSRHAWSIGTAIIFLGATVVLSRVNIGPIVILAIAIAALVGIVAAIAWIKK